MRARRACFVRPLRLAYPAVSNLPSAAIRSSSPCAATPAATASIYTQDFLLERAAILPMDIRIEAGLFAQTRSFFVIPGDWFNSSSDDNVQAYANVRAARPGPALTWPQCRPGQNRFPFFGQPIDMKITIDGSVSEAAPADITAQTAWMLKWGWIPQYHGGLVTGNPPARTSRRRFARERRDAARHRPEIIYNPLAGFPYY